MHSVELERLNANIIDLDFGENQYICLFWLICAWREPDEAAEGDIVRLYTQWIDIAEHRIEGYTDPGDAAEVVDLIIEGAIYKIHNPYLIRARLCMRSCPGYFALAIRSEHLLRKVDKDLDRPFFPVDVFNLLSLQSLRSPHARRNASSDVIGRLTVVTRPVTSVEGTINFTFVVDHPRFSHLHVPLCMLHPTQAHLFAFFRGDIPQNCICQPYVNNNLSCLLNEITLLESVDFGADHIFRSESWKFSLYRWLLQLLSPRAVCGCNNNN